MLEKRTSAEQEINNLAREALALPERARVRLFELLREDLGDSVPPRPEDELNRRRSDALAAFDRVAKHFDLDDRGRRGLRMREFDSAPESVREGWQAARVAAAFFDSWATAKAAASGERMPVPNELKWKRKELSRHRRAALRHQTSIDAWLDTDPEDCSAAAYDQWVKQFNGGRREEGEPPAVRSDAIRRAWGRAWIEIVADARTGSLVRDEDLDKSTDNDGEGRQEEGPEALSAVPETSAFEAAEPKDFSFDVLLLARRVHALRSARGWTQTDVARRAQLDPSHISIIEAGKRREVTFIAVARLAKALDVSVDHFLTDDGQEGLPRKS